MPEREAGGRLSLAPHPYRLPMNPRHPHLPHQYPASCRISTPSSVLHCPTPTFPSSFLHPYAHPSSPLPSHPYLLSTTLPALSLPLTLYHYPAPPLPPIPPPPSITPSSIPHLPHLLHPYLPLSSLLPTLNPVTPSSSHFSWSILRSCLQL